MANPDKTANGAWVAAATATVFLVTVGFAAWASYLTSESASWYREQATRALAGSNDPLASALILTVYTGFIKKQIALGIAGMLALLGLGLSLHALRTASRAEAALGNGVTVSLSSVSPGVCAFLAATVIVVAVVVTRDSFGAVPQQEAAETGTAVNK